MNVVPSPQFLSKGKVGWSQKGRGGVMRIEMLVAPSGDESNRMSPVPSQGACK